MANILLFATIVMIKVNVDMETLLRKLGFQPHNGRARCILHDGENPTSFSYNEDVWYCFACGRSGDKFKLIIEVHNFSPKDAIKWIRQEFGPDAVEISNQRSTWGFDTDKFKSVMKKYNITLSDEEIERVKALCKKIKLAPSPTFYDIAKTMEEIEDLIEQRTIKALRALNKKLKTGRIFEPECYEYYADQQWLEYLLDEFNKSRDARSRSWKKIYEEHPKNWLSILAPALERFCSYLENCLKGDGKMGTIKIVRVESKGVEQKDIHTRLAEAIVELMKLLKEELKEKEKLGPLPKEIYERDKSTVLSLGLSLLDKLKKKSMTEEEIQRTLAVIRVMIKLLKEKAIYKEMKQELRRFIITIRKTEDKNLRDFEKRKAISRFVIESLTKWGSLYKTASPEYQLLYFDDWEKRLYDLFSGGFKRFINDLTWLNPTEKEFKYLLEEMGTEADRNGEPIKPYRFVHYDKEKNLLYIYRNDNHIYRLDGEKFQLIPNGEDGVLFWDIDEGEPFKPLKLRETNDSTQGAIDNSSEEESGDEIDKILINRINFVQGSDVNEQRLVFRLWLFSLFFPELHQTKPILTFLGEKGSGKTFTFRALLKLLFGKEADVTSITQEDAFKAAIANNYLLALDNVDGRINWLNNQLALAATGQVIRFRELYTTNEERVVKPRCFIAINSRSPCFRRPDVADRLLLLRVERFEQFTSEQALLDEILKKRNLFWTTLLLRLNRIVKVLKERPEPTFTDFRMADWAEFARIAAKVEGKEEVFKQIIEKMKRAQGEFVLEGDPIFHILEIALRNEDKIETDAITLFEKLKGIAESNNISWPYKNPRSLAQRLTHVWDDLREFFDVERIPVDGGKKYKYQFKGKRNI